MKKPRYMLFSGNGGQTLVRDMEDNLYVMASFASKTLARKVCDNLNKEHNAANQQPA